jgi:hypothetical protein
MAILVSFRTAEDHGFRQFDARQTARLKSRTATAQVRSGRGLIDSLLFRQGLQVLEAVVPSRMVTAVFRKTRMASMHSTSAGSIRAFVNLTSRCAQIPRP